MDIVRPASNQPIPANAKHVFSGVIFDVYQWQQEMYDGTVETFERLRRPDTVVVFPILEDGRIMLTLQEQPGKTAFIGAAGGRVDPGEDVLSAAKRELREETGLQAHELVLWEASQPGVKMDWAVFVFVAKGCRIVGEIDPDPGEKIELYPVTFDEFLNIALRPEFTEKEVVRHVLEAKLDSEKMKKLRELFSA